MTPDDIDAKIRRGLEVMTEPGQVFEIRSWKGDRISSGYFDDIDAAAAAIAPLDAAGADGPDGIYLTLNPVNPDLLARRANRIKPATKKDASTSDADIIRRRWLPIDIDAKRASGISSTDQEHAAALERALSIAADLAERGWPEPIRADSANGAHLVYRIDLPNDEKSTALVKAVLAVLDAIYSDGAAEVDTSVFNASRIWKVYGTVSRKGDNTPTRPHRRAAILAMPDAPDTVTREQLAALAMHLPTADPAPRPAGRQMGDTLDVATWLRDHGIEVRDDRPYNGGTLYRLDDCPFSGGHKDGAFVIQFPSGAIHAGCHHNSCGSGSQRWPELRERFEGKRPDAVKKTATPSKTAPAAAAAATATPTDPAIDSEARRILEHGDPIDYHRKAFAKLHSGDREIGDVWLMAGMTQAAITTAGIQPGFSGKKGAGKSHGTRTALHLHPPEYVIDGSFSNRALLYDTIPPGSIIYSDDTYLPPDTASMIKRAMTGFQTGIEHRTVNKNGGRNVAERLKIPHRCLFAFSSVYDAGDDEIQDRQYLISLAPTAEDDKRWLDFLKERLEAGCEEFPVTRDVLVCREMIRQVKAHAFRVRIPFIGRIAFAAPGAKRDVLMFFDFLQASAILHYLQREHRTGTDGIIEVDADEADYHNAVEIFQASEQTRAFKIGKAERALLQWIGEHSTPGEGIEESKVIREYGEKFKANRATIRRLLYGRDGNGGLVNKVPGVDKVMEARHTPGGKSQKNIIYVDSLAAAAVSLGEFVAFVELRPPVKGDPGDPGVIRH